MAEIRICLTMSEVDELRDLKNNKYNMINYSVNEFSEFLLKLAIKDFTYKDTKDL